MNLHLTCLVATILASTPALAADTIKVTIESLTNVSGGGAMEACGKAVHSSGKKPLLVTIRHDQSYYSTLTSANDVWCSVIKRWTYNGSIEVGATALDEVDDLRFEALSVPGKERM